MRWYATVLGIAAITSAGGVLASSGTASAQPPLCEDWEEVLTVDFPERIPPGLVTEVPVSWRTDADTTTAVTEILAADGDQPPTSIPVPPPGLSSAIPVTPRTGEAVRVSVTWLQSAGTIGACTGTAAGVMGVTPTRTSLVRYAGRMRPALVAWSVDARAAAPYLERGIALLRTIDETDLGSLVRIAPQAGMAMAPAAPILQSAAKGFARRAARITPPRGLAAPQRGLVRQFTRMARSIEVASNVLGRVSNPFDLISAAGTISNLQIGEIGEAWADELITTYEGARLVVPGWLKRMGSD